MKKIALLGDIAFFGKNSVNENDKIWNYFEDIACYLKSCDYVVGNLEAPFVENSNPLAGKSASIKSAPNNIEILKYLNIKAVTLANNHIYDFGSKGYDFTKNVLSDSGIEYFGVEDKVLTFDDELIAFSGFCCFSTNPFGLGNKAVNALEINKVNEVLEEYSKKGYLNIVSIHAGQEHVNMPAYHDIEMAKKFSEVTPYIYYGHHPHVMQGIMEYGQSLFAFSLGNFCFDDVYTNKSNKPLVKQSENNKRSFILILTVEQGVLINYETIGLYAGKSKMLINYDESISDLKKFSSSLSIEKEKYTDIRNKIINLYIEQRKKMRDINWYIKRLNINSLRIILNARRNAKKHKINVLNQLNNINE